jgi:Tfp pilus assembly protein PilZ
MPAAARDSSSSGAHAIGSLARSQVRDTFTNEASMVELPLEPAARAGELRQELAIASEQLAQLLLERDRLEDRVLAAKSQVALLEGIVEELASTSVDSKKLPASSLPDTLRIRALPSLQPATVHPISERLPELVLARVTMRTIPFAVDVADHDSQRGQPLSLVGRADLPVRADPSTPANCPIQAALPARRCEVEAEFLDETYLFSGLDQDVVGSGVFVATYQSVAPGAAVELELELPNGPLYALGEVRWTRPEKEDADQRPGIGIVFMGLSPAATATLQEVLRSHVTRYHEV